MKLKELVNENWLEEKKKLTKEQKKELLEKIKKFGKYAKSIYNENNLVQIAKELSEMCKNTEMLTLSEVGDEFDGITVGRNMKELKNLSGQFAKVATEAHALNQRMSTLYEDMGIIMNRYYEVQMDESVLNSSTDIQNNDETKPYADWNVEITNESLGAKNSPIKKKLTLVKKQK